MNSEYSIHVYAANRGMQGHENILKKKKKQCNLFECHVVCCLPLFRIGPWEWKISLLSLGFLWLRKSFRVWWRGAASSPWRRTRWRPTGRWAAFSFAKVGSSKRPRGRNIMLSRTSQGAFVRKGLQPSWEKQQHTANFKGSQMTGRKE